ncbi:hypothetical protein KAR91_72020 [Candidatus Pacearchaeota archaeon]|nr:hypothetical protein [Candidatus Pacearchaeota archaeon]
MIATKIFLTFIILTILFLALLVIWKPNKSMLLHTEESLTIPPNIKFIIRTPEDPEWRGTKTIDGIPPKEDERIFEWEE